MEKISTEIATLFKKIQDISKEYADIKDIFLDDGNMELVEDSVSVIKFLNNSRKALLLIKFKYFLRGLNYENVEKESINKLIAYVDTQEKAEFITNSFDKIISSNSKLSCCIMGLLLNDMTKRRCNITQEELMILQVLPMLNDFDIKNFYYLYKIVSKRKGKYHNIVSSDIELCAKKCNTIKKNIYLTIDVLEKYGLVDKEADVSLDVDKDHFDMSSVDYDEDVYFNSLSEKLYSYVQVLFLE